MLGHDIAAVLPELRAAAESNMLDSCAITRVDPDAERGEMDPDTMQYPDPQRLTVYVGKCRVQIKSAVATSSDSVAGDREGTVQDYELQLPVVGSEEVAVGDVVEILTASSDGALTERLFTVAARHEKSQATARRLRIREVTA